MSRSLLALAAALSLACAACASSDDAAPDASAPERCTSVDPACEPTYEPSYDAIFTRVLQPTCGKSGVSCHSTRGRQGALSFEDADVAYDELLASAVRPGNAACSELVVRLESTDSAERMPPPAAIPAEDRCAIVRWIQAGAPRR